MRQISGIIVRLHNVVVEGKVLALDRSEVWFLTPLLAGWEYLGKLGNGWKIALWASVSHPENGDKDNRDVARIRKMQNVCKVPIR